MSNNELRAFNSVLESAKWPKDVGIVTMEIYFPSTFVEQSELESYDGVSPGKYTIGLGQSKMGFCSDREDIYSLCLTVVSNLMRKTKISYCDIGRLEVGTETILDKSKSVKTVLMQLFEKSGNFNIEGVDTKNACYGGTSALFNALNWIESSSWDGRYALVVAGDIAVYASGNARCTGGAGAIAMLIGPKAALIIDRGLRGTHIEHVYDFYKPDMSSEYPVVDGKLSIQSYLKALDSCYKLYCHKYALLNKKSSPFHVDNADAFIFHSPYCKLVQKSFARLVLNDFIRLPDTTTLPPEYSSLEPFRNVKLDDTYFDKSVESAFMKVSENNFICKVYPSLLLAKQVGNMYTPSLYGGLASYLASFSSVEDIAAKRIVMFSYGSGLASSMFSLRVTHDTSEHSPLRGLYDSVKDLKVRLNERVCVTPPEFEDTLTLREKIHNSANYTPTGDIDCLFPGTFYLTHVDSQYRRQYSQVPLNDLPFNHC